MATGIDLSADGDRYFRRLVSDFFLPAVGGVEVHIYSLGVELQRRGHKVGLDGVR